MTYINYIEKAIISGNNLGITSIYNIEIIKQIFYYPELYNTALSLIKNKDISALKIMPGGEKAFEDISVVKFTSQQGLTYIATIYDSDELWQDPELIEVFDM